MTWDDVGRTSEVESGRDRDRWIGVYIGVLAVILAVCGMGGSYAAKEATLKNIEASNTWSFFQAKNIRRHVLRVQNDELELLVATQPAMPDSTKAAIVAKIAQYKDQIQNLTSEPKTGEGLDELLKKGKLLESERDLAMRRDPYFDYAQAFLQIAIVLASVSIVSGGSFLLAGSGVLGALGTLLTLNGYTLAVVVPGVG
jgi:hypothetical protein